MEERQKLEMAARIKMLREVGPYKQPEIADKLGDGNWYLMKALQRRFGGMWKAGYSRDVGCRQISRLRQRCDASWIVGDFGYYVRARVRLFPVAGKWGIAVVRGRATVYNEYCFAVTHPGDARACTGYRRVGPIRIGV